MSTRFRLATAALAPALALTLLQPAAASASTQGAEVTSCPVEVPAEAPKKKKKVLGLGGLLGDSKAAQVAGVVAGTAIEDADAASAVSGAAESSRMAQAAGAVIGVASELARQAPAAGCEVAAE